MKSRFLIITCFLTMLVLNAVQAVNITGSGTIVSRVVKVSNFNSVSLSSSADVQIIKGNSFSVILTDYENLLDVHTFTLSGGVLQIGTKPNTSINNSRARIKITLPEPLYSVKISGSGDVNIGNFNTLKEIAIAGSGDVKSVANNSYRSLDIKVSGSGDIELRGKAENLSVSLSGSGDIDLQKLRSQNVDCRVMGSGDVDVYAEKNLKVNVSGSGDVTYAGSPRVVEKIVQGSGSVRKR